jgi:hypothetical protein
MSISVELMLACDLREDTPQQVIDVLNYVVRKEDGDPYDQPEFPIKDGIELMSRGNWFNLFRNGKYGEEFSGIFPGVVVREFRKGKYESNLYKLTIRYEFDYLIEFIEAGFPFLEWIAPYINTEYADDKKGVFVGYLFHTNFEIYPTLIYIKDEKVFFDEVENTTSTEVTSENLLDFF